MSESLVVQVNGRDVAVQPGTTVLAAVEIAGAQLYRRSRSGEPRVPLCGMGICFECRVVIDGIAHRRSCQATCVAGMVVRTDD